MRLSTHTPSGRNSLNKQHGVVLFFALIALLAMSLAAVALIRSVDTSTLIAGNLAFKQAATSSGDAGVDAAIDWLAATQTANPPSVVNVFTDTTHPFNNTGGTVGFANPAYYSSVDNTSLTDGTGFQWDDTDSMLVGTDSSGNTVRYIIQRMCRNANQPINTADCLFSGAIEDGNGKAVPNSTEVCSGTGCPAAGQTPQIRVTARTTGPNNTISYVQAFVY